MGIFGSIIGGTLGMLAGGPLGMVLGSVIGGQIGSDSAQSDFGGSPYSGGGTARSGYERVGRVNPRQAQRDLQLAFAMALTSLAAKVAKADGRVTQDEIEAFDHFLKHSLHLSLEERKLAAEVFNQARNSTATTHEFTDQVRSIFRNQPDRLRDIVTILLAIALADGHLHPKEERLIQQIARDLGLSERDYQSCRATYKMSHGEPETSPYEVLGVSSSATDAEVRAAHRRLVREYHPDVLASKGLSEDFTEFAHEKMTAINDAWSRVKKQRNL
ncbi:MAG: DnaJ domain-containing protein [Planctomycetes bacterium]|nr:DnaJ domain-containing protein [Planctomycetota bacterium]MCP4769999.1 DnaJ domain-containing protein [Planctomycetota bacterium]MCP4859839.1 DnaJ domain-containing protein [Planctomycetota bacterium]